MRGSSPFIPDCIHSTGGKYYHGVRKCERESLLYSRSSDLQALHAEYIANTRKNWQGSTLFKHGSNANSEMDHSPTTETPVRRNKSTKFAALFISTLSCSRPLGKVEV